MQHDETTTLNITMYSAGVAVLNKQNELLLVKEQQGEAKGLWHIPSGRTEEGEAFEAAALREAYEETGLSLNLQRLLNSYVAILPTQNVMCMVFLAEIQNPSHPQTQPDTTNQQNPTQDYKFISKLEFDELYRAGLIRMVQTKMTFEDALRARGIVD